MWISVSVGFVDTPGNEPNPVTIREIADENGSGLEGGEPKVMDAAQC